MMTKTVCCPQCGSKSLYKDGLRYLKDSSTVQRWLCKSCGYRFSDPDSMEDCKHSAVRNVQKTPPLRLKTPDALPYGCRVGVALARGARNLVKVEPRIQKRAAGATKLSEVDVKGKLVEFLWWMKKEGFAESTIIRRVRLLKTLNKRGANLWDLESVKLTIANQETWSNTTKEHAVVAYTSFLKMHGETWKKPKYSRVRKLPFIPTETEIDQLIASCNKKTAAFLQLLKETGMRRGEAWNLKWTDLDFQNKSVRVTPEKGGNPRVLKISSKLIAMLKLLPQQTPEPFNGSLIHFARSFRRQRRKSSHKLQNRRIEQIHFHTFRHWKATMEYHRTKDILYVKQLLGHKSIQNTMKYTQLMDFKDDEFTCKVAETIREAKELVESGFDFVTDMDAKKLFRKRK